MGSLDVLDGTGVIALCPRCNGWTMFHAVADSNTGREWTEICRKAGDVIVTGDIESLRAQLKHSCNGAEHDASARKCESSRV